MANSDASQYILRYNEITQALEVGTGNNWFPVTLSGGAVPGGSSGQFQINSSGTFGGSALLTQPDGGDIVMQDQGSGATLTIGSDANGSIRFDNTALNAQFAEIQGTASGLILSPGSNTFTLTPDGSIQWAQLSADPATPREGEMWYNATSHTWKGFNGSATVTFTVS